MDEDCIEGWLTITGTKKRIKALVEKILHTKYIFCLHYDCKNGIKDYQCSYGSSVSL